MRRRLPVEPTSRLAVWSLRFVVFGLAVALAAIVLARADWLDGLQAVLALGAGLTFVLTGVLSSLVAGGIIWVKGYAGARHAVAAGLVGGLALAYPASFAASGLGAPAVNDVTTDFDDPPAFDLVAGARPASANPTDYDPRFAPIQRMLFPEVRPIDLDLPAGDVNDLVADFVDRQRWRVLDQVDFRGPGRDGRTEMVTRSLVMGFRDDMVIRIRAAGGRTRIDMRSASRYGRQDFGVNARRVIATMEDLRLAARRVQR